jgi:hypothetical protein
LKEKYNLLAMLSIEEQNAIMNNAGSIVMFFVIFTKRFEVLLIKPGGNGGDLTSLGILFFPVKAIFST